MPYGLQVYDLKGNKIVTISSRLPRFRYGTIVDPGIMGSVKLSDIVNYSAVAIPVSVDMANYRLSFHSTNINGEYVTWNPLGSVGGAASPGTSLILVFYY